MPALRTAGTVAFAAAAEDAPRPKDNRLILRPIPTIYAARTEYIVWTFAATSPIEKPLINYPALNLIRSWRNEDPQKQREEWQALEQVLEEDRPSDRKLFS